VRVLAFDTATRLTTVALRDLGQEPNVCMVSALDLAAVDDPPAGGRPGHAQKLLSLTQALLDEAGTDWGQIDRLAVGVGPGTFTGLRIGIATAHALAQSTGIELVGVGTLASLQRAAQASLGPQQRVLAVIDARRGEAFVAGAAIAPTVVPPEGLSAITGRLGGARAGVNSSNGATAVGDGAIKFREMLEAAGATVPPDDSPLHRVSARWHCVLAAETDANGAVVEPLYLRVPDAELNNPA
jgi:tRNA threonylcarbamoyladenosine biosynthesis protein TsaB